MGSADGFGVIEALADAGYDVADFKIAVFCLAAVLAGIVWMLEHPNDGLVEADEMDFRRCLEIQRPYLGKIFGAYTDWTPLHSRPGLFPEELDHDDPWQFSNVLVR